jgi:two-component sensor histidine kinase/PAS domain-containing protein
MIQGQTGAFCMAGAGYGEADTGEEVLHDRPVAVAVIGGATGALPALRAVLGSLPRDSGLALILLVQDTAPEVVEDVLARIGGWSLVRAQAGTTLLPNRLHLVPSGAALRVRPGRLAAGEDAAPGGLDALLESLADSEGTGAIAVVLSGEGADGAGGIVAVRRQGGQVVVQDPAEAAAPQAPGHAIATGLVGQVLPAAEIGAALGRLSAAARQAELGDPALRAIRQPVAVLDAAGRVLRANAAFREAFGSAPPGGDGPAGGSPAGRAAAGRLPGRAGWAGGGWRGNDRGGGAAGRWPGPAPAAADGAQPGAPSAADPAWVEDITEATRLAARLELAKAVAERADRDRSRFLAAASHDLRQPLQSMSMLHGLLAAKASDPAMLRLIARLDETIDTMSGILDTLLDLNQMEAGRTQAAIAPVAMGPLLAGLQREFAEAARGAGLECAACPARGWCSAMRACCGRSCTTPRHALKYTRRGRILLGCRRAGGMLRIEVWDTGIGIPRAQMPAVFEEVNQVGSTARARSQGIGLGLAIARRLADLLGHPIGVRSREGVGSCFHIDVPLAAEAPAQPVPPASASASSSGHGASW